VKTSILAKTLARELRKNQTSAEKLLWGKLRNRAFAGFKFTRQHPIYYFRDDTKKFFIADFYCHELKLIIELDGKIHLRQKDYDVAREDILKAKSFKIIRFTNDDIEINADSCLQKILFDIKNKVPFSVASEKSRRRSDAPAGEG
jgi:very-short-patch-repair endonuclease